MPRISSCAPGRSFEPYHFRINARRRLSSTSVLLPEPETPVTQVKLPIGMRTLRFLRLFSFAPRISRLGAASAEASSGEDRRPRDLRALICSTHFTCLRLLGIGI